MAIQAETSVDAAFECVVDDEIHRRQTGQDITCHAGRAPVREDREHALLGDLLQQEVECPGPVRDDTDVRAIALVPRARVCDCMQRYFD